MADLSWLRGDVFLNAENRRALESKIVQWIDEQRQTLEALIENAKDRAFEGSCNRGEARRALEENPDKETIRELLLLLDQSNLSRKRALAIMEKLDAILELGELLKRS